MIATVQNTKKKVTVNGQPATVWEGLSQRGTRFHLFVITARPMDANDPNPLAFQTELAEAKIPAVDTNVLPAEITA
jgi:hypothetical protein